MAKNSESSNPLHHKKLWKLIHSFVLGLLMKVQVGLMQLNEISTYIEKVKIVLGSDENEYKLSDLSMHDHEGRNGAHSPFSLVINDLLLHNDMLDFGASTIC